MFDNNGKPMSKKQIREYLRHKTTKDIVEFAHSSMHRGFYKGEHWRLNEYEADIDLSLEELARRAEKVNCTNTPIGLKY